jgi:hypothetical protein
MLKGRDLFLSSVGAFAILFWVWALLGYPLEVTICEPSGSPYKCSDHYVPVGIIRWVLFQVDRYGVLLTAVFTGFIAWFTWTLRQSTEKMWIETKKAADAADLSAKAVTIVEFPIIRTAWIGPDLLSVGGLIELGMSGESYGGVVNDGPPTEFSVVSEIEYRNHGRSPAFPIHMFIGYAVVKKLPDIPAFKSWGNPSPSSILKERESGKIEIHFGFQLTEAERTAIANSEAVLWFYAMMTYLDIMDRHHEIGSCWQWGKQNPADDIMYFFDNGSAPVAYTKRT